MSALAAEKPPWEEQWDRESRGRYERLEPAEYERRYFAEMQKMKGRKRDRDMLVEEVARAGSYPDTELVILLSQYELKPECRFGWAGTVWSDRMGPDPDLEASLESVYIDEYFGVSWRDFLKKPCEPGEITWIGYVPSHWER